MKKKSNNAKELIDECDWLINTIYRHGRYTDYVISPSQTSSIRLKLHTFTDNGITIKRISSLDKLSSFKDTVDVKYYPQYQAFSRDGQTASLTDSEIIEVLTINKE